jgi:protein TonB
MLAYAANRPVVVDRRPHPNAMLFIIGAHVAVAALVMSARMDLPPRFSPGRTIVDFFPLPKPVPHPKQPHESRPTPHQTMQDTTVDHPDQKVQTELGSRDLNIGGENMSTKLPPIDLPPDPRPPVHADPVRSGPQLLTTASDLKPPYPASKLLNEEEASLTLRLTIDPNGRVVAVQPVGRTDPVFLEAARRHLLARWRYKPALEDGQAVVSSTVITLRFQLDG